MTPLLRELSTRNQSALVKDLARLWNISPTSVYRFFQNGHIPPARQIQLVKYFNLDPHLLLEDDDEPKEKQNDKS